MEVGCTYVNMGLSMSKTGLTSLLFYLNGFTNLLLIKRNLSSSLFSSKPIYGLENKTKKITQGWQLKYPVTKNNVS